MSSSENEAPVTEAAGDDADGGHRILGGGGGRSGRTPRSLTVSDLDKSSPRSGSSLPVASRWGRAGRSKSAGNGIPVAEPPKTSRMSKTGRSPSSVPTANGDIGISLENYSDCMIDSRLATPTEDCYAVDGSETSISSKNENSSPSLERDWQLGQLAWARVGTFPFWPCVVNLEPDTLIFHKMRSHGRNQSSMVHVRYFGDKGRHSWVSANHLIPFNGIEEFQKLAGMITPEMKKKDSKYVAAFIVKPGIKPKWMISVEEATEVLALTDEQRADTFKPKIKEDKALKSKTPKTPKIVLKEKPAKRKLSPDNVGPPAKQAKQDNNNIAIDLEDKPEKAKPKKQKREENVKTEVRLNADTPPTPPSSHKDSSDEAPLPQKPRLKQPKDLSDEDFESYFERNRDKVEDQQPDASEAEIRKYLKKTWCIMNGGPKSNFQGRMTAEKNIPRAESSSSDEADLSLDLDRTPTTGKKSKIKNEKVDTSVTSSDAVGAKKKRPYNLFKGMKQERVCQICEKIGKLTRCRGPCYSYFHLSCVKPGESSPEHSMDGNTTDDDELNEDLKTIKENMVEDDDYNEDKEGKNEEAEEEAFKCIDCLSGVAPACFICNEREGDRIRCSVLACGKHYHSACLKPWPQSHWQGGRLSCPYHLCHTCSSDNPRDCHSRAPNEKMARCVRCPSSYHPSTSCLPAGSVILTGSQVVCPKHHKSPQPPLNAAWCFLCTRGGSLICCDTCPTSFHPECLGIDAPDGAFICEDCETGRLPLYGEIVWVKLGNYRWWPSRICYPHEVPVNVAAIPHSPGEFCVMFLGTKDYYWVHRGRAFLYQDGDANTKATTGKKNVDEAYRRALEEANEMHQRLKTERAAIKDNGPRGLKPPHYVKLKVNKPVGNVKPIEVDSIAACDCDADWDNPCAPETDCLNRILSVECSPGICPAGPKCLNQAFVRRQYPTMEPFHTTGRGWGLRALESIKLGQFVIEYVGEVIDEAEYRRRLHRKKEMKDENFYFLTIDNYRMIDAEPKGNLSRFMNHSCQPNCETQKWTVNGDTRIGLFALRDIESGEELTFNYNLACDGETRKPCLCGAPNCSGFIGLKAQKQVQPLNSTLDKKIDKGDKVIEKSDKAKKQRRSGRVLLCWTCGDEISDVNDLVKCDQKTCNKRYHKSCVTVEEARFSCPWHHCAVCSRRTSQHCSFCSTAFCQVHVEGKLTEHGEKGGLICSAHESMDPRGTMLTELEKEDSDDTETEKEDSPVGMGSPVLTERPPPRMPSPRVAIVEVNLSSEEGEESQKEDEDEETTAGKGKEVGATESSQIPAKKRSRRLSLRMQREEETIKTLNALTSSQLEAIIGGSMVKPVPLLPDCRTDHNGCKDHGSMTD